MTRPRESQGAGRVKRYCSLSEGIDLALAHGVVATCDEQSLGGSCVSKRVVGSEAC